MMFRIDEKIATSYNVFRKRCLTITAVVFFGAAMYLALSGSVGSGDWNGLNHSRLIHVTRRLVYPFLIARSIIEVAVAGDNTVAVK